MPILRQADTGRRKKIDVIYLLKGAQLTSTSHLHAELERLNLVIRCGAGLKMTVRLTLWHTI